MGEGRRGEKTEIFKGAGVGEGYRQTHNTGCDNDLCRGAAGLRDLEEDRNDQENTISGGGSDLLTTDY